MFNGELCHHSCSWDKYGDVENSCMFGGAHNSVSLRKRQTQRCVGFIYECIASNTHSRYTAKLYYFELFNTFLNEDIYKKRFI